MSTITELEDLFDVSAKSHDFDLERTLELFGITEEEWSYKYNNIVCSGYKIVLGFHDEYGRLMLPEERFQFGANEEGFYPTPIIYALYCDGEDGAALICRNFDSHDGSFCMTIPLGNYIEFDDTFTHMQYFMEGIVEMASYGSVDERMTLKWNKKRYEFERFTGEEEANKLMEYDIYRK